MQHALTAKIRVALASALWVGVAPAQPAEAVEAAPGSTADAAAPAAEPGRVVLMMGPGLDDLAVRLVAELGALGAQVERAPDAAVAPSAEELEELARRHEARVALGVSRRDRALDLWLVNPETREVVYRRIVVSRDPAVAVLRLLEILRGALVDFQLLAEEPDAPPEPAPSPPTELEDEEEDEHEAEAPAPEVPALWVGLSGTLIAANAGGDLGAGVSASVQGRIGSHFAIQATVLGPVSAWSVEGEGGSAEIRLAAATIGGNVMPWGERLLTPGLGLGVGLVGLYTKGEPLDGYRGAADLHFAAFPHGRLELAVGPIGAIRLEAACMAGFVTPRPALLFAEERAESWLNPLFLLNLGAEMAVP